MRHLATNLDGKSLRVFALVLVGLCAQGCKDKGAAEPSERDYSTVEIVADRRIFMGGVITPTPSTGEFLVIVELSPADLPDSRKLCDLCRAGHPVSVHLRQDAADGAPPILVKDITSGAEAIIRCKTRQEAQRTIDQLHAWPSR